MIKLCENLNWISNISFLFLYLGQLCCGCVRLGFFVFLGGVRVFCQIGKLI